jgi:hypothetical protein
MNTRANSGGANTSRYSASAPSGKAKQTQPFAADVTSHAYPRQQTDKHYATENMHATVSDQRCYEIAHTDLVAGTFSGFISGTKMSTQEFVTSSSTSQYSEAARANAV